MRGQDYRGGTFRKRITRRAAIKGAAKAGAGLAGLSLLAGCGEEQKEAKPSTSATPESGQAKASEPKYGGMWQEAITWDPLSFDPHTAYSGSSLNVIGRCYNRLVRMSPGVNYQFAPDLAEKWEIPDNTTYIFHLFQGVKFHDVAPVNGREMTAEDAVYSMKRILTDDPEFRYRTSYGKVKSVEAVDKYTVKVTLLEPYSPFLDAVAGGWGWNVVPKEAVEAWKDLNTKTAGTGAFMLKEWKRDAGGILVKNPNYFRKDSAGRKLPYLDGIDFRVITDASTALASFRAKNIDAWGINYTDLEEFKKGYNDLVILDFPVMAHRIISIISNKKPFDDFRVRKAVHLAFDRQEAIKRYAFGDAEATGPVLTGKPGSISKDELLKMPGYRQPKDQDIAEAKKLLAEAGYPNGFKLVIKTSSGGPGYAEMATVAQQQLKKINIDATIEDIEFTHYLQDIYLKADFDMSTMSYNESMTGYADYAGWRTANRITGVPNLFGAGSPELDQMIDKATETADPAQRDKIGLDIQHYLLEKGLYAIWVLWTYRHPAYWNYVKGYQPGFQWNGYQYMEDIWLDK